MNSIEAKDLISGLNYKFYFDKDRLVSSQCISSNKLSTHLYVAPGLVDLQVNGYKGFDFNQAPFNKNQLISMVHEMLKLGITSFLPTIITNSVETTSILLKSINDAIKSDPTVASSIIGIHLEGPFLSAEDGPRGAHNSKYIIEPDWSLFSKWQELSGNNIVIVTISPEYEKSIDFIKQCVTSGVVVSIGHTNASSEQIVKAVNAGASLSTHLGNGSHVMQNRHHNYVWPQLANEDLASCIISDGFHVPNDLLKVITKVKRNKAFITSDSTMIAGQEAGEYETFIGGKVVLTPEGRLHMAGNPNTLAGSSSNILQCVEYLTKSNIVSLKDAWLMASKYPLEYICSKTKLTYSSYSNDFVFFQYNNDKLTISNTIKNSQIMPI